MRVRLLAAVGIAAGVSLNSHAQLFISEFMANPPGGNDSPNEWVELIATENINFAVTPYSVIFSDNGTTRFGTNGWATGANVTYGFEIISGTVSRGDVVYVGGTGMTPTGVRLREINTGTTPGDGLGNANTGGVLGNGGSVADGIAVFNSAMANITASLRPIDAILFGSSPTGAVFLTQYQLPQNDNYPGGAVDTSSFLAPDPGGGQTIFATGAYNTETAAWEFARTWSVGTVSDNLSGIALTPVPEPSALVVSGLGLVFGAWAVRRRKR